MKEWVVEFDDPCVSELASELEWDEGDEDDEKVAGFQFLLAVERGLKIVIQADEHPPPHFEVKYNGGKNSFRICDGSPIHEKPLKSHFRTIRKWHRDNKQKLIECWDRMRPSDCPVGKYRE